MTGKPAAAPFLLNRPALVASFAIVVASAAGVAAAEDRPPEEGVTVVAAPLPAPAPDPALPPRLPAPAELLRLPASPASSSEPAPPMPGRPLDWAGMPASELRERADAGSIAAMEEMARRLVRGIGMPKDPQAGAGWLMRAAQSGSAQSAFNVAVMYERGFMLERNFTRAIEWYRRAVEGDLAIAKHNLGLMLRDGKGTARSGREAVELLQSAARQGMAASMFSLGEIYERDDEVPRDVPTALAWFAIAAEFERQANRGAETALARTSASRAVALQQGLTHEELKKAEEIGQEEFRRIVEAMERPARARVRLTPLPPAGVAAAIPPPAPRRTGAFPPLPPPELDPPDWPTTRRDQVRIVQRALFDLKLLREEPDGALGPMTRAAIRTFQRINAQRETGLPTRELYASLKEAVTRRDVAPPARPETRPEPPVAVASARRPEAPVAMVEPSKPIALAATETPPPPSSTDITRLMPPPPAPPTPIRLAAAAPPPPPPTSADIRKAVPVDPDAWPATSAAQVSAIQALLREMRFYRSAPDGRVGPATRAAIRKYERMAGLKVTGQPGKALFDSLKETQLLVAPKPKDGSN